MAYLIDALSYLAVLGSLFSMRLKEAAPSAARQRPWQELVEGFNYAFRFPPIRALILLVAIVSFAGFSYTTLMPAVAHDRFGGDAQTLGVLMSASGFGAVLGAIYLGSRQSVRGLGRVITWGGFLMGAGLVTLASSSWMAVSLLGLAAAGLGGVLLMA
jgi:predicted MFS family arabinose efflux permease